MKRKYAFIRLLALLTVISLLLPCAALSQEEAGDGVVTCRALLVGCDQFHSEDETTPIAHNNIQMMETILSLDTRGYTISRLDGVANSAASLQAAIDWAFAGADGDDLSLLYISTHGQFDADQTLPEGSVLLSDGSLEERIGAQALEAMFQDVPGEKVLLVDACASGALIGKGVAPGGGAARVRGAFRGDGFHALVSSGANELSWYWQMNAKEVPTGASYFTAALAAGAGLYGSFPADQNSDNVITLHEMYTYLRTSQPSSTAQIYPQEDDLPLLCYSTQSESEQVLGDLTGIVFQRTALNPINPVVTLFYTATVETRVAYNITPYVDGQWDWDSAVLLPDETEWDDAANPAGQVFPGRRLAEVDLTGILPQGWHYAMIHVVTLTGTEDNTPGAVYAGRVLHANVSGDPELSVRASSTWRRATRPELEIFVAHSLPCSLTVTIENSDGETVKTLAAAAGTRPESLVPEGSLFYWNGTLRDGSDAPAGNYSIRITALVGGETYEAERAITLE